MPATTANQVPSRIWSTAAAAATLAASSLARPMEPEVSTMMVSPASPDPV